MVKKYIYQKAKFGAPKIGEFGGHMRPHVAYATDGTGLQGAVHEVKCMHFRRK